MELPDIPEPQGGPLEIHTPLAPMFPELNLPDEASAAMTDLPELPTGPDLPDIFDI
jgi:hypothetical protein